MTESPRSYPLDPGETPSEVPEVGILPISGINLSRLLDVLGEAADAHRLPWAEVHVVLTIIERYEHVASETYWSIYLALAPKAKGETTAEVAA